MIVNVGFSMVVKPYSITLARKGIVVDVYVYPTTGRVVYFDGNVLLEHCVPSVFEDVKILVLESRAEAVLAAAHAVYKERIYTLNDYVTIAKWLNERSLRLAAGSALRRLLSSPME